MTNSNKIISVSMFFSLILGGLISCDKGDKSAPIRSSNRHVRQYDQTNNNNLNDALNQNANGDFIFNKVNYVGTVFGNNRELFQQAIDGFMSGGTSNPVDIIGLVSHTPNDTTGVRMNGHINAKSGAFSSSGMQSGEIIDSDSYVSLLIWDDQAVTSHQAQIPLLKFVDSYTQGSNTLVLEFADKVGSMTLTGEFSNGMYGGTMTYQNNKYWTNQTPGASASMSFFIPVCSMFVCN